jgi:hypothetical protein
MTAEQQGSAIRDAWEKDAAAERKCPDCGGKTARMGLDFKAPKKGDSKAWDEVEKFNLSGKTFYRGTI